MFSWCSVGWIGILKLSGFQRPFTEERDGHDEVCRIGEFPHYQGNPPKRIPHAIILVRSRATPAGNFEERSDHGPPSPGRRGDS